MDRPKRKPIRLENFDYSQNGAYFITLCVQNRKPILSRIVVGASTARQPRPELSAFGEIVDRAIQEIEHHYPDVSVDHYVIMPNHIHMILRIEHDDEQNDGRPMVAPTGRANVSRVIQQMKGYVTKRCGTAFWQKSFYDHVIRDEQDYQIRWQYIDENPAKWCEDSLYVE